MNKRIGLDLDGTICNTTDEILRRLSKQNKVPQHITAEDIVCYGMEWNPIKQTGFPDVNEDDLHDLFEQPEFWESIKMYKGVKKTLRKISQYYDIHVVTARTWHPGVKEATINWLNKNGIPYKNVTSSPSMRKDEIAALWDFTYFIEDFADAANNIVNQVEKVFLIDRPWNRTENLSPKCIRVNWENIGDFLFENDKEKRHVITKNA